MDKHNVTIEKLSGQSNWPRWKFWLLCCWRGVKFSISWMAVALSPLSVIILVEAVAALENGEINDADAMLTLLTALDVGLSALVLTCTSAKQVW